MAASITELAKEYLFRARNELTATDYAAQKEWLWGLYQKLVALGNREITAHSFEGASHSTQFRGASPEDYRLALMSAIETLEGLIAGNVAQSERRPFGVRWIGSPYEILG